ncbi:MAG: cobalamin-dependent protein [Candidatus Omnitrophica bacterium]|nr:cobalamin-dependent protein [Candidatus Omnitrophota bacterium]
MKKNKVYFNEYNIVMDNSIYLPLVSGLLQSNAQADRRLREQYEFMPFLFVRRTPEQIVAQYAEPAVAAFSVSMWNMNLSLEVARRVKAGFPGCLIVFGGPQVPFEAEQFYGEHPFIDVTARGEGEQSFAQILERNLESRDFSGIPGISFRDPESGKYVKNAAERKPEKDLDRFPSPYLDGLYDYLFKGDINFQVIIETNRGCPFMCSYCFWGQGGLSKQYRFFSLDRVRAIVDWCSARKIQYVFCADSNFGMFKRDLDIAGYFAQNKAARGFPEKLRVCYSKNTEDNVFEIGKLLTRGAMEKGITMSRQTNCPLVASNVGRKNIRMSVYNSLQKKYNAENIPIYTELILGLPGETYESFKKGIEEILQSGIRNQVFVYLCQVYPNTELADERYQKKFGIRTQQVPLNEIHASVHSDASITEYEEVVVATKAMNTGDWKKTVVLSWVMQLFHGLKAGFFVSVYLVQRYGLEYTDFFEFIISSSKKPHGTGIMRRIMADLFRTADGITRGKPRGAILPDFGPIYWEQEEAAFLAISCDKEGFYNELYDAVKEYLEAKGIPYRADEVREVVAYQQARIPDYKPGNQKEYRFNYNLPEYFDARSSEEKPALAARPQVMALDAAKDYGGDKIAFAREVIVYGRKSNRILKPVSWHNAGDLDNAAALTGKAELDRGG